MRRRDDALRGISTHHINLLDTKLFQSDLGVCLRGGSGNKLSYRVGLHLTQRPPTLSQERNGPLCGDAQHRAGTYIRPVLPPKGKRTRVDQSTRVVLRLQLIYTIENRPCREGEIVGMAAKIFGAREILPPLMPLIQFI